MFSSLLLLFSNTTAPPDTRGNKTVHIYSGYILFWSPLAPAMLSQRKNSGQLFIFRKIMLYTFCRNNELELRKECPPGREIYGFEDTHILFRTVYLSKISIVCNQCLAAFRYLMRVHKKVIAYYLALPPVEPVDISIVGGNSNSRYSNYNSTYNMHMQQLSTTYKFLN